VEARITVTMRASNMMFMKPRIIVYADILYLRRIMNSDIKQIKGEIKE
jgi:hypothetical protein